MDDSQAKIHEEGCRPSSDEPNAWLRSVIHSENENDESFIELSPDAMRPASTEFEFQIYSSSVSNQGLCHQSSADVLFDNGRIVPLRNMEEISKIESSSDRETQFSRSRSSPPDFGGPRSNTDEDNRPSAAAVKDQTRTKNRRPSKMITMVLKDGVMKFLIKLPLEKIRSSFCSLIKSFDDLYYSSKAGTNGETDSKPRRVLLLLPFNKWKPQRKRKGNELHGRKICTTYNQLYDTKPRKPKRSMSIARGALNSLNLSFRGRAMDFRSNPSSNVASPAPRGALEKDSSISAAIAHCKMSLECGDDHKLQR